MSTDQARLVSACRQLVALVDNAQSGLATWHSMCIRQVDAIRSALGDSEALERARVVGVLDAWQVGGEEREIHTSACGWSATVTLWTGRNAPHGMTDKPYRLFQADTLDAARAAAAKAIETGEV